MISFFVPGPPRGKGRPRFEQGHARTDAATLSAENEIRWYARKAMVGKAPAAGALRLTIEARYNRPKSWPKKRLDVWKTSKPDLDNVVKLVKDALNKIAWLDDAQVVSLIASKIYQDGPEGLHVEIDEMNLD